MLYWSAIKFFGGPGESARKNFVKIPGNNTQRRVAQFAKQIADRIYKTMIFELAHEQVISIDRQYELIGSVTEDTRKEKYTLGGKYEFKVKSVNTDGESEECEIKWKSHNKIKIQSILHNLHPDLITILFRESSLHLQENGGDEDITIIGYTEMK